MRFTCEPEELASWMEAVDKHRKNFIDYEPFELDEGLASNEDRNRFFESHFGRHGWKMPDDVVCYKGGDLVVDLDSMCGIHRLPKQDLSTLAIGKKSIRA